MWVRDKTNQGTCVQLALDMGVLSLTKQAHSFGMDVSLNLARQQKYPGVHFSSLGWFSSSDLF